MTRSGKENMQGGVLLRKLSKVHKKMCQEMEERKCESRDRLWDLPESMCDLLPDKWRKECLLFLCRLLLS